MNFRIRFSRSVVKEGRLLLTRIKAPRRRAGEPLQWRIGGKGIQRKDFSDGRLGGELRLDERGRATLRHPIRADGRREGRETVRFRLLPERKRGGSLASRRFKLADVDTRSPEPTPRKPGYSLAVNKGRVAEGKRVRTRLRAPKALRGERLFWSVEGRGISRDDFRDRSLRGSLRVDRRGRARLSSRLRADRRSEGTETARVRLFSDRGRTDLLAGGRFRIRDTSRSSPASTPSPPATPSTPPAPPSTPPQAPALPFQRLRIMPMGDSITLGFGSEAQGGYRGPLASRLRSAPYAVDFVGKFGSGLRHWGESGALISESRDPITGEAFVALRSGSDARNPFNRNLADDLDQAISTTYFSRSSATRNVLLLTIGTNDFINQVVNRSSGAVTSGDLNNDASGEQQAAMGEANYRRLRSFLGRVNTAAGRSGLTLEVLVATIPTQLPNPGRSDRPASSVTRSEIGEYNALIKRTLDGSPAFGNLELTVVDQSSVVGGNLRDGIHPTTTGYNAMANAWFNGIQASLLT